MSEAQNAGFGKFIPGFDFLQNLAKGATETVPQMPNLANWIAPTLNVEELDKRITELKAVHFWLDQNSKALGATVQALEVQKMTLATLKGMNFNIGDMANALKPKAATTAHSLSEVASDADDMAEKVRKAAKPVTDMAAGLIDPMQLWSSLTQQFGQIAASAMKDAGKATAMDATKNMAAGFAKEAVKATKKVAASTGSKGATAKKAPAKAVKKTVRRST